MLHLSHSVALMRRMHGVSIAYCPMITHASRISRAKMVAIGTLKSTGAGASAAAVALDILYQVVRYS